MHNEANNDASEILVAGGGLVGTSLALALAQRGRRVILVEPRSAAPPPQSAADTRHLALAEGSVMALERLGVWAGMAADAGPIAQIELSRRGAPGQLCLNAAECGFARFGAVVPAPQLLQALERRVAEVAAISMLAGVSVLTSRVEAERRIVSLSDGSEHAVQLLVAADGSDSPLRVEAQLPVQQQDYQQSLISCAVRSEQAHAGRAYERLDRDGPLALLPRPDGRMGLVWALPSAEAAQMHAASDQEFIAAYQQRFGYRLGRLSAPSKRSLWPLRLIFARQLFAERLVLVGNAAQTLHPIGAQGFNLGLRDALALAQIAAAAEDPGSAPTLSTYAERRHPDRQATLDWTGQLLALRPGASPLGPLAGLALTLVDLLPGAQLGLIERAMGLAVVPMLPEAA